MTMADHDDFKRMDIYDEALITKAMNHLTHADPQNATREDAISLLTFMQTVAKSIADTSTMSLEDYYKLYKEQKAKP
jgi:hypothetical protein